MKRTVSQRAPGQLRKIRKELKKRGGTSKLTDATISRALSGKVRPLGQDASPDGGGPECGNGLPARGDLSAEDIPPKLRAHICIGVRPPGDSTSEGREGRPCRCWEPFVRKLLSLPPEGQIAMDAAADAILKILAGQEGKERLTYLSKLMAPFSKALDEKKDK